MKRLAIIGAGLAGLTLAQGLNGKAEITVFEKSRGVSGRLATRCLGDYEFDHGAQFFTARSKAFQQFLKPYIAEGIVDEWQPHVLTLRNGEKPYTRQWFEAHYVAVPRMNTLCKSLADNLDIRLETVINGITCNAQQQWLLGIEGDQLSEPYDWVISTAPANQTGVLLGEHMQDKVQATEIMLDDVEFSPCYSLMLGFDQTIELPFQAAKAKHSSIEWIMVNSSKPGRAACLTLVIQSNNDWAQQHLEKDDDWIISTLLAELQLLLGHSLPQASVQSLQRWRYARVEQALQQDAMIDHEKRLAACGDWCISGRVESAFLSASNLAYALEQYL
ncbi:MAG: FAD-dependent oxidoreductase [Gammaproteobacteria bacterium]|nr:FAD-dependent oxidoreductase [Gammaproteobacteria bacterium]